MDSGRQRGTQPVAAIRGVARTRMSLSRETASSNWLRSRTRPVSIRRGMLSKETGEVIAIMRKGKHALDRPVQFGLCGEF
ncbi:hypothetical protein MASR2M8_15170 [Opitutaceae bacterium]